MNHKQAPLLLGTIRMSPLMYGSLRYIATRHHNGALNITELSQLKQTQIRCFMIRGWITETADRRGIVITTKGRQAIKSFEENDEFFRHVERMSFTSLLNLVIPGVETPTRIQPISEKRGRKAAAA